MLGHNHSASATRNYFKSDAMSLSTNDQAFRVVDSESQSVHPRGSDLATKNTRLTELLGSKLVCLSLKVNSIDNVCRFFVLKTCAQKHFPFFTKFIKHNRFIDAIFYYYKNVTHKIIKTDKHFCNKQKRFLCN